jgi:hypothetical protein
MWVYWVSVTVGLAMIVAALTFIARKIGKEGEVTLQLPFGWKVERASTAVVILCIGALFFDGSIWLIAHESGSSTTKSGASGTAPILVGEVTSIDNVPSTTNVKTELDWGKWLLRYFREAQINISIGLDKGIEQGDYFATINKPERLRNLPQGRIANLQDNATALIKAARVYPTSTIGQLESWAYNLADEPVSRGQSVVWIPREEAIARNDIEDSYNETLSDRTSKAEKHIRYRDMIRGADRFLVSYPNGFFAADVLFHKGYAQYQLGRYSEAIETFELFGDRYPFHPSASGASEWITKAEKRLSS